MNLHSALPATEDWRGRHVVVCDRREKYRPKAVQGEPDGTRTGLGEGNGGTESTEGTERGGQWRRPDQGGFHSTETARELHRAGVRVTYLTARPRGAARRETTVHGTVVRGGGRLTAGLFVLLWLFRRRHTVDAVIDVRDLRNARRGLPFFSPLVLPRRTPVALLVLGPHRQWANPLRGPRRLLTGAGLLHRIACLVRRVEARSIRLVYGRRALCTVMSPASRDACASQDESSPARDASPAALRANLGWRGAMYPAPPGPANAAHLLAALTAEHQRLHEPGTPARLPGGARTLVVLPRAALDGADLAALHVTDLVDASAPRSSLLLAGTGEHGAKEVLNRIGIDPSDEHVEIRAARDDEVLTRQHDVGGRHRYAPARLPLAPRPQSPRRPTRGPTLSPRAAVALLALCAFAFVLRMTAIDSAYDLHVDECYYVEVARSIARGDGPAYHGGYFALHPPAFFAVLAAVLQVIGGSGDLMTDVLALRPVSAVLGAVMVLAATLLLRRAARPGVAWAVALLLALDPFLNRFDSRAMLEAQAMAATVVGLLILARTPCGRRARTAAAVGAGLAFAVAVTTKDWYSLITFLPVGVLGLLSKGAVRRMRFTAAAVTAAGYGTYVAVTAATGGWPAWREQKLDGILRALGVKQITGFGSPHNTTDLHGRLLAHLDGYLVPYGLIGLGACATGWLLWCRRRHPGLFAASPARSLLTAAAACSYPADAYAVVWGTTEEQMFYPTVVLSALAVGLAAHLFPQARALRGALSGGGRSRTCSRSRTGIRSRSARIVAMLPLLLAALALTMDARAWTRVHTSPDDAHRRTRVWVDRHVPHDATVAATDDTVPQAVPRALQRDFDEPEDLARLRPGYVIVSRELIAQGYTTITPGLYADLDRYARLVHREPGATAKALEIYELRRPADAPSRRDRR
jgi:hypothetical protein